MNFFRKKLAFWINNLLKEYELLKKKVPDKVSLGKVFLGSNVHIGEYTYINSGLVVGSEKSKVIIGKHCSIGRNVNIRSFSHDLKKPTSDEENIIHDHIYDDITIGDYVWIGDNVYIKPGITIGNYAVIGANSVVLKNVEEFEIVGGIPAKHIRYNTEHYRYKK